MAEDTDEGKDKPDTGKETASLNKRLKKHEGDAMALAAELSAEVADLNRQLRAAKGDKPKEGSIILTPEQAKHWDAFIALGKPEEVIAAYQEYVALGKAEDVKTKITEHANLALENTTLKKTQVLQDVATDEKLKFKFLRDRDTADGGLSYEKRDTTIDGKTQQVWHVKRDNKWVTVASQIEEGGPWADYKPLLTASGDTGNGTKVPGQVADDKTPPPKTDVGAEFFKKVQEARDKKVNPLAKTA